MADQKCDVCGCHVPPNEDDRGGIAELGIRYARRNRYATRRLQWKWRICNDCSHHLWNAMAARHKQDGPDRCVCWKCIIRRQQEALRA